MRNTRHVTRAGCLYPWYSLGVFNTHEFYEAIVEWFEETKSEEDKRLVDDLLLWWNRSVCQPFRIIIAANWKVQEGIRTNICFPDSARPLCSEVCGEVAEDVPYHYWWPDCRIVQPMYYV